MCGFGEIINTCINLGMRGEKGWGTCLDYSPDYSNFKSYNLTLFRLQLPAIVLMADWNSVHAGVASQELLICCTVFAIASSSLASKFSKWFIGLRLSCPARFSALAMAP